MQCELYISIFKAATSVMCSINIDARTSTLSSVLFSRQPKQPISANR